MKNDNVIQYRYFICRLLFLKPQLTVIDGIFGRGEWRGRLLKTIEATESSRRGKIM